LRRGGGDGRRGGNGTEPWMIREDLGKCVKREYVRCRKRTHRRRRIVDMAGVIKQLIQHVFFYFIFLL